MHANNRIKYWFLCVFVSLAALVVIGVKWNHAINAKRNVENRVNNETDLKRMMSKQDTIEFQGGRNTITIPTGLFIQSLDFIDSNDVNLTGFIWAKYPLNAPDIEKGIFFPEQVYSQDSVLQEMYAHVDESRGQVTMGWYFDVTLRQQLDYSAYPLDIHTVGLRIWAKDLNHADTMLHVPDFESYNKDSATKDSRQKFGLDVAMVPGEWLIDETFFNFKNIRYDSDFGLNMNEQQIYKEMYFQIGIRRKFTNAFIVNLVPLFIVALLLFSQVMTVTGDEKKAEKFGFNTSGILATCSALFFVVILAHTQVRDLFPGEGLVYIEYFYLIMYVAILFTAINAYAFTLAGISHLNLIYYLDNFIAKLTFWPFVLWMLAIVTLIRL